MKAITIILFSILFCLTTNAFAQSNYPHSKKTTDTSSLNKLDLSLDQFNELVEILAIAEGIKEDVALDKRIKNAYKKLEKLEENMVLSKKPTLYEMAYDIFDGIVPPYIQLLIYEALKNK